MIETIKYDIIGATRFVLIDDGEIIALKNYYPWQKIQIGQIYCGRVGEVDLRLNAAFIDIGDEIGFLSLKGKRPEHIKTGNKILVKVIRTKGNDKKTQLAFVGVAKENINCPALYKDAIFHGNWPAPGDANIDEIEKIELAIEAINSKQIALNNGGHIIIEPTSALVAIDIDGGGRTYNGQNIGNFKHKLNYAAAQMIAKQIIRRNLGGIIIIDFVGAPFGLEAESLIKTLENGLNKYKPYIENKIDIIGISRLGICQIARQKLGDTIEIDAPQLIAIAAINALAKSLQTAKGRIVKLRISTIIKAILDFPPFDWKQELHDKIGGQFEIIIDDKVDFEVE